MIITKEVYTLNKECIKTLAEIKIKYIIFSKSLSEQAHSLIKELTRENKEYENDLKYSRENNADKRVIR